MKEITIGRNGNQPFAIHASGVSSSHAKLTITDDEHWILEDLESTNGTFIRNEHYGFDRIGKIRVSPSTVIRLGDETVNGFTFTARQVVKMNQNDFSTEFSELRQKWKAHKTKEQQIERWINNSTLLSPAIMILSMFFISQKTSMVAIRAIMLIASFPSVIVAWHLKKKKVQEAEMASAIFCCPKCWKRLSVNEIDKAQCLSCGAH